jgi:ubiquinone/menaquinone biosynthesis C-methylase UbiE
MKNPNNKNEHKTISSWNKSASTYDNWYKRFGGAIGHIIDWTILQRYLPKDKDAKILDTAGGTGRIAKPLAELGYSVTLTDISSGMLNIAREKLKAANLSDKVEIIECSNRSLPFENSSFDFVLSWGGPTDAAGELVRVLKKGGLLSMFFNNKWSMAMEKFYESRSVVLDALKTKPTFLEDKEGKYQIVDPTEAESILESLGIDNLGIYGVYGWLTHLGFPDKILESTAWDKELFDQTSEMVLKMSQEPSVLGLARHLVAYGKKI